MGVTIAGMIPLSFIDTFPFIPVQEHIKLMEQIFPSKVAGFADQRNVRFLGLTNGVHDARLNLTYRENADAVYGIENFQQSVSAKDTQGQLFFVP
jgi:hypothetical protein